MSKDVRIIPFAPEAALEAGSRLQSGAQTNNQPANYQVVERRPKLVRYKDLETLKDDLIQYAGPVAYFFRHEDTPSARRAMYYQYERGNLPGAIEYGSSVAISKSLALATMWAQATKRLDERTKQLMALHLQLGELAAALADCNGGQVDVAKLGALLSATRDAIGTVVKIPDRD